MARPSLIDTSSVSTKLLIALTGLALFFYLIVHLGGNLLILLGATTYNGYAAMLLGNPLIVPVEIGLTAIFVIHIYNAVLMWWDNRKARPQPYYRKEWAGYTSRKSLASSTMIYTGLITLIFIVLHVKMFKYGDIPLVGPNHEEDLFLVVTRTFHDPLWVAFYELCLVLLGFHLWHGFASAFESLGMHYSGSNAGVVRLSKALAILIAGGFFFIPLWVYFLGGRS
jgi:succinate dehydrogenase / fumarate reductase, cytochrome b subunit